MNKGIIILSIDDGSADHYRLFETLAAKNIPATFNIVTNRIDGEHQLTRAQLREIYAHPLMEIACHGHAHQNDDADILHGKALLREWLALPDGPIGFASPGSQMKQGWIRENEQHLKELGLLYVRSAENREPCSRHEQLKKQYADAPKFITHNIPQLIFELDGLFVPSAVVYHDTPVGEIKALIDLAIAERAALVLMFHRAKKQGEHNYDELWNYDFDRMQELLDYIAAKREKGALNIMSTQQAFCNEAK